MRWRIVAALVVAFVVGGVVGAVVERERIKRSDNSSPSAAVPTASTADVTAWFGTNLAAACPGLRTWTLTSYEYAIAQKRPDTAWPAKRLALTAASTASADAYRAVLPNATPLGAAELQFLIDGESKAQQALATATTAEPYTAYRQTVDMNRTLRDGAVLLAAVKSCPTA